MLSESWCNKRSFSVYSALYTCLLRMGRSSTRNIQVKGFSKYASKPDALKKVLLYMLGCVEMLAMIYKNCSLHAVIGERSFKVFQSVSPAKFSQTFRWGSRRSKNLGGEKFAKNLAGNCNLHRSLSSQLSNIFKFFLYLAVRWNFLSLSSTSLLVGVDRESFPIFSYFSYISRFLMKFSESFATSNLRGSWSSQFWNIFKFFLYLAVRWNFLRL